LFKRTKGATDIAFTSTDIIPLVNVAWQASFANYKNSRKALAKRGWNPLNRFLLTDPLILQTQRQSTERVNGGLNFDNGPAADILDKIAANRDQQAAKERRLAQNREALDNKAIYQRARKLTSGAMVGAGEYHLGNDLLEHAQKHAAVRAADVASKVERKVQRAIKLCEDAAAVRLKERSNWNGADLRKMCAYKKGKNDRIPKGKADLEAFYETIKDNTSPDKPPPMPALNSASLPVQLIESSDEDDDNGVVSNAI
jgi:hypothetical protein